MLSIGEFAQLGQVSPRTLRHYNDVGLLVPDRIDPSTGYRSYRIGQLARLHRILALRDLGFRLDQIGAVVDGNLGVEALRGMLRLRQAQIEATVAEEQARLGRVEARLRFLERSNTMPVPDVVVKMTQPLTVAEATAVAPGFGPVLNKTFQALVPRVLEHLQRVDARAGMMVGWYEEPRDDGSLVAHVGFEIYDRAVASGDGVSVITLPVVEVASVVHHGSMKDIVPVYEALVEWIEDSGYRLGGRSRELYLEFHEDDHSRNVAELQMPIAR
ncbi:MAG: MerR family transcriptional regulator [Actinomycetota bacterium]|nr:MerR family transcriptional regulator [Actinomycetota bacterium]